jgi:hypothetical protein
LHKQNLETTSLQQELDAVNSTQAKPGKYVLEARKKLGKVVAQQFSEWMLSDSEKQVVWLLLTV